MEMADYYWLKDVDRPAFERMLRLREEAADGKNAALSREARLLEESLGFTPASRKALRIRYPRAVR